MSLKQRLYDGSPIWAQNLAVTAYGYYLKRKRYSPESAAVRRQIEECRQWSPEEVADYQNRRFAEILTECFSAVPFYQESFKSHGIGRGDVTDLRDLARLPILPKDVVRRRGPEMVSSATPSHWIQHTSGSTGTPLDIHINQWTYQLVHGLLSDFERQHGVGARDLRATFAGRLTQPVSRMTPPFWRYNHAERQILFSSYHLNEETLPFYVRELAKRQPAQIIGYPSAIATVADYMVRHDLIATVRPRLIITNSETLFDWQRTLIERAFACSVRDYYGSAEAVVFAGQCEQGAYHVNPLLGVAEILDASGATAHEGILTCTTLTNRSMPLVRYEIGDTAIRKNEPCACGSHWPAFTQIVGRVDDMIITADGRQIGRMDHIFKGLHGIRECQVIQESVDRIRLIIVKAPDFNDSQMLLDNTRERLGPDVQVDLEYVESIPRTRSGKFRGVISRVRAPQRTGTADPGIPT